MSKFLDLLNSPLPSLFNESDDFSDEDEKAIAIASSIVDDEDDDDEDDVDDKDDDDTIEEKAVYKINKDNGIVTMKIMK